MTHFTWSRECGMRGLFCLSLCAIVMKMLFISPCDESDFDETSNNGKSFESANFWARWRDTCWAPSKSILFPTISLGILSPSKCVSASWSQLGSDRNEFSLNCYFKKILWKASSRNDQTIVCFDIKISHTVWLILERVKTNDSLVLKLHDSWIFFLLWRYH